MNKRAELYVTEVGKEGNKKVASKIETTIVNIIKDTKVQGYEEWNKAVFETPTGTYRVYIGLKYGVGDANKLAEYIVANADINVDIGPRRDKRNSTQVYCSASFGATRMEEGKVLEIKCDES